MAVGGAGRWFLLPGLVFLFAIDLIPLVYSGWVSFYNWWLIRPRDVRFVGLANYARLWGDPEFGRAVVVTTVFTTGAVLVEFLVGLALALLFAQPFRFLRPIRVLLLLPLFVVPVVGATMWRVIFHPELGVLNYYLALLGLGRPPWLSDPTLALVSITLVDAWRTIPFMFLVMYAGLEVLPAELFEAAAVDGASAWQRFRHITVPLLAYIMLLAVLIRGHGRLPGIRHHLRPDRRRAGDGHPDHSDPELPGVRSRPHGRGERHWHRHPRPGGPDVLRPDARDPASARARAGLTCSPPGFARP